MHVARHSIAQGVRGALLSAVHQGTRSNLRIDPAVTPEAGEVELDAAIREGAVQRVRPKAMTVAVILAGLFPIMAGSGAGSEVMQRIAAPMVGGMLSAPLLSMLIIPAVYRLLCQRRIARRNGIGPAPRG